MEKIEKIFKQYSAKPSDLSDGLLAEFNELQEVIKKYNSAVDTYEASGEKDAETDNSLDAMEDLIEANETSIAEKISAELEAKKIAAATPTPEPTPTPTPEPVVTPTPEPVVTPEPVAGENKDGWGWVIAGALGLVGLGWLYKKSS